MMKRRLWLQGWAAAPWLIGAGSSAAMAASAVAVPFETLLQGGQSGVGDLLTAVARDAASWQALWARHAAVQVPPPPAPSVDFAQRMVIAVFAGSQPTLCHGVAIEEVLRDADGLRVRWRLSEPPPGRMCPMAIAHPVHLVTVPRSDAPVRFVRAP